MGSEILVCNCIFFIVLILLYICLVFCGLYSKRALMSIFLFSPFLDLHNLYRKPHIETNIAYFEHDLGYGYSMNERFSSCSYLIYQILRFLSESFGHETSGYLTIPQTTSTLAISPPFKPSDTVLNVQRGALATCQVGDVI